MRNARLPIFDREVASVAAWKLSGAWCGPELKLKFEQIVQAVNAAKAGDSIQR
jgi:hypothetical protein